MIATVDGRGPAAPRPTKPHQYRDPACQRRNLQILAIQHVLALEPSQLEALIRLFPAGVGARDLAQFLGRPYASVRKFLQAARETELPDDEHDTLSAAELRELLDTPLTDDPSGPRYRDDPACAAWLAEHSRPA